jgi:septal ring factor EnvC (AmiA/AmiB activator)
MMLETIAVGVLVGTVLALAIVWSISAWRKWLDRRHNWLDRRRKWLERLRSIEPDRSRAVATNSAFGAEKKRLADLKAELGAAETIIAERERQISKKLDELTAAQHERTEAAGELAKQEAALAQRERILEKSLADAARSAAEARARIEAREAALATQEAGLQQQEREPADPPRRSAAERDLIWWEKQLGRPRSANK